VSGGSKRRDGGGKKLQFQRWSSDGGEAILLRVERFSCPRDDGEGQQRPKRKNVKERDVWARRTDAIPKRPSIHHPKELCGGWQSSDCKVTLKRGGGRSPGDGNTRAKKCRVEEAWVGAKGSRKEKSEFKL